MSKNILLSKYILLSFFLHVFLGVFLFYSKPRFNFEIKSGFSSPELKMEKIFSKKIEEEKRLVSQKKFRVKVSSFLVPPPKVIKRKPPLKKEEESSSKIGALYQKSRQLSLNNPPRYPYLARKMGYEGVVLLQIEVLPSGHVGQVLVLKSSGFSILDDSACDAAGKWIFFERDNFSLKSAVKIKQKIRFLLE